MYDAVIIGGGPGGYVSAIRIAQLGGKVALVEKDNLGGTCLNRGCIPTKSLVAAAEKLMAVLKAEEFGIEVGKPVINFSAIQVKKAEVVETLVKGIDFLMRKNKIDLIKGKAMIKDSALVQVNTGSDIRELACTNIIIATGSSPAMIKALGYNGSTIITSEEALMLKEVPESLIIIGAGVIGCEFAHIYGTLGSKITMVESAPSILPLLDKDLSKRLQMMLKKKNVSIKTKVMIQSMQETAEGVVARLESGETLSAQKALISIGRSLNTQELGLEDLGVALGAKGEIIVSDQMKTNVPGVYAIGDVVNKYQLAHVASAQGIIAAENIMGQETVMDYTAVPSCIFTHPELASVGITEQMAKEKEMPITVGKFNFMANGKALSMGEPEGLVKIIAHRESDVVLGVHIIGPHASDMIGEATLAVKKSMTAKDLAATIHAHPTLTEAIMEAAENVHGLSIHG
ncbi:dihydrolipoamide dehydrogenase [Desulfosporosinus orientis DSM 765]|uniref:Dihydrolipoyl dehydrogenase n=1 Tax=Desulfosporosinus orientis (strain ATCC 19365 / DSM 765 / NCIMB 8382 / VKM B-1628 / Singapore I) TaxID=768706 RepID=G7WEL7_DESOD|nr:dihydrolipoyl dehydrogenase [Desulfosporosinus orientis]AET66908.1 dihydrolipoamide dehydrogenase [Desulfosporosinus orientis DSM 765]